MMTNDLPDLNTEISLGGGLHASSDGWQITLRAPRIITITSTDGSSHAFSSDTIVVMERSVYQTFLKWVSQNPVFWKHFAAPAQRSVQK